MENSTAMTIEFLRARLLSERSVSRTAKERADELAKRVMELEEKLKTVTLQRKKAERATVEVLSILENNETCDFSETFDSNSVQERFPCDSKEDNNPMKEEDSFVTFEHRKNEVEEISGSELESSPSSGGGLSWKSCRDTPSLEKKNCTDYSRRQYGVLSTGISSTKLREGRSCRKIKRMETISATDEVGYESFLFDAQEGGGNIGLGGDLENFRFRPDISEERLEKEEKVRLADPDSLKGQLRETSGPNISRSKTRANMENPVGDPAQLIDQNMAQEKAQSEWEKKFKENDNHTPDFCEYGKPSNVTEETVVDPVDIVPSVGQGETSEKEEVLKDGQERANMLRNVTLSAISHDMVFSEGPEYKCTSVDQKGDASSESSFQNQETPRSTGKEKEKQDWTDTQSCLSSDYQATKNFSPKAYGSQSSGESSNQNELQLAVWHEAPNELEVLQELQRAKLSLKHELNRSTKVSPAMQMTETSVLGIEGGDSMKLPIGCARLFRVPTDFPLEATSRPKTSFPCSNAGLDKRKYPLDLRGMESEQPKSGHNLGIGSRDSFERPYVDPSMDMGMSLLPSSGYTYHSYADLKPIMTSCEGLPRSFSSFKAEMPANDRYSLYSQHVRLNMHHRY